MGLSNLQVYNIVYKIIDRNNKFQHYVPGYYEQELVNFENFVNFLKQNTPEPILQLKIDLANTYEILIKIRGEYGIEDILTQYPILIVKHLEKKIIEGSKE